MMRIDFPENKNTRYVMKVDLDTLSLNLMGYYSTLRGFYGSDAFSFAAKNQYLFIAAFSGQPLQALMKN